MSPNGQQLYWILCSSGARSLYLENIVRCLALPEGQTIRFRYNEDIVSDSFKKAEKEKRLGGTTGYVTYFDEEGSVKNESNFVPVREVEIVECRLVGSSYILDLRAKGFINLRGTSSLIDYLQQKGSIVDPLPQKTTCGLSGCWVASLKHPLHKNYVAHITGTKSSFRIFEEAVRTLEKHDHFSKGTYKFYSIFDFQNKQGKSLYPKLKTVSGRTFIFSLYHYTSLNVGNEKFFMEIKSNDPIVRFRETGPLQLKTNYDLLDMPFTIKEKSLWGAFYMSVNLVHKSNDKSPQQIVSSMELRLNNHINWKSMIPVCLLIMAGLSIAQLPRLDLTDKATLAPSFQLLFIFAGSFLAAAAATFGIKKSL